MIHIDCNHSGVWKMLCLGETNATDENVKALALNTNLTSLSLWRNNITAEGAKALALNTTLTCLNLGNNKIGNEGAKAFALNTTLIRLYIWRNEINDEGVKALALNTTLTSLDLDDNNVTTESAKALSLNTTLIHLSMNYVSMDYVSAGWRMTLKDQMELNLRHLCERRGQFIRCLIVLARDANNDGSVSFWHLLIPDMRRYIIQHACHHWNVGLSYQETQTCATFISEHITQLNEDIRMGIPLKVIHHNKIILSAPTS